MSVKKKGKPRPKKKVAKKKTSLKPEKEKRRADYDVMDDIIEGALTELWGNNKKFPSMAAIARKIGCNIATIKRHVADESIGERLKKYRIATPFVIRNLLKQASTGKDHAHIKLWLEKIEGLNPKMDLTSKGQKIQPITGMVILSSIPKDDK